jgi:hypothetical protein
MSTIFLTTFLPEATTRMSRRPKRLTAAATMASQSASVDCLELGAEIAAGGGDVVEGLLVAAGGGDPGAGAGQHLGGEGPERAGGADNQRHLTLDVEER